MADTPANANDWRTTFRRRAAVAATAFLLWSAAIEARLVFLQVIQHDELSARAERQQSRTIESSAKRGEIVDRRGRVLAYSVDAETVYAVPTEIDDPVKAAGALCGALADCTPKERQALADRIERGRHFVYVRRQITPEQARRVSALDLAGIGFVKENRRFYPNKQLASHLLGYVGIDNTGLSGIEATYDSLIKGKSGTVLVQTDARRHAFSRLERPPTAGANLELTIDQYLQHIVERELQAGVEWSQAAGGSAVVMDPMTGEILALANYPTYNPNAYRDYKDDQRRNRAIQDLYEPGSTFKIVTASAALEEKAFAPADMINVSGGQIRFGTRVIRDTHDYGVLSFEDMIVKSSNVGAIRVGLKLGPERLSEYVTRFGFGRAASPDFRGESPGIVWSAARLNDSALASVSMGYQVGVTPLQMAAAVSAVANGGELIEPRLVRAVVRDGTRLPVPRKVLRRTISPGTATQLTTIMEGVVKNGTATQAQIDGYTIAGKTGTAAKIVNGAYSKSEYNVSFVGFVPSRKPAFTIIVVIDAPHAPGISRYGGTVAAPIFQKIASAALRQYGVPRTINAAPPILVARREEIREQPMSGPIEPPPFDAAQGKPFDSAEGRSIVTVAGPATGSASAFPDLRGLSARDALRVLSRLGMGARMRGTGIVIDQQPVPGSPIESGETATLWLERQTAVHLASRTQP